MLLTHQRNQDQDFVQRIHKNIEISVKDFNFHIFKNVVSLNKYINQCSLLYNYKHYEMLLKIETLKAAQMVTSR